MWQRMINPRKIAILSALYFVQGMPFGFQAKTLPVFLRSEGISTSQIGWLGVLALPWLLKPLWAPFVDRYGTRRQWIVPLQAALAGLCFLVSTLDPGADLHWLLVVVFLMNLFAATQDIAVDGLAVELLGDEELGPGNSAQVVGYKLGMLTSGGLLMMLVDDAGWSVVFIAMGVITTMALVVVAWIPKQHQRLASAKPSSVAEVLKVLLATVRQPAGVWVLVLIVTYKCGEAMNDSMFKPFLVDIGVTPGQIGLWLGSWGMGFSILGSVIGGAAVVKLGMGSALIITAVARLIPLVGQYALALHGEPDALYIIITTCSEHFFGGALTTVMFAFMMSRVDPSIGGTHFTALAALEVLGKMWGAPVAGHLVEALGGTGYSTVFLLGSFLSLVFIGLVWTARNSVFRPMVVD
jgi:MFS family permease